MSVSPRPLLIIMAAIAMWAAASGCGGASRTREDAPPSPTPARSTPAAQSSPASGVEVTGSTYRFLKKGYAIDVPQGWIARPNYLVDVAGGQFPTDALFLSSTSGNAQPTISIECLKASDEQQTLDAFRDARVAFLGQIGKSVDAPRPVQIGDRSGYAIDYVQEIAAPGAPLVLEKTDAVTIAGGCRWLATLSAPQGQRAPHAAEFDALLRSMRFFTPQ